MNKLKIAIAVISIFASSMSYGAATESSRCTEVQDSLNGEQAQGRTKWTAKCFPHFRTHLADDGLLYLKDSQTGALKLGYPFIVEVDENYKPLNFFLAPIDPSAPCLDANRYNFGGFCLAGCYTPDQMLLFEDGYTEIAEAHKTKRQDIMTLGADATLENITLSRSELQSYTADPVEKEQEILVITMKTGNQLKVTPNHPLVDGNGMMRTATSLNVNDVLVHEDGGLDSIVSIESVQYFGKVYNVDMGDTDLLNNIVVAQGYLNGTVFYQNNGASQLNRAVLRSGNLIPDQMLK